MRRRLSTNSTPRSPLCRNHESMVSTKRTALQSRPVVRHERDRDYGCRGHVVWLRSHSKLGSRLLANVSDVAAIPLNCATLTTSSLFLTNGLLTVVSVPVVWYYLDSDIGSARFLTEHEKKQALERLRANNSGTGSREFKLAHVWEALLEPKSWLFVFLTLCLNVGVSNSARLHTRYRNQAHSQYRQQSQTPSGPSLSPAST